MTYSASLEAFGYVDTLPPSKPRRNFFGRVFVSRVVNDPDAVARAARDRLEGAVWMDVRLAYGQEAVSLRDTPGTLFRLQTTAPVDRDPLVEVRRFYEAAAILAVQATIYDERHPLPEADLSLGARVIPIELPPPG
jgi:hypothetical protein